ncbi:PGA3 [Symbiodinium sp. CCMP2592]|nr:PGA3 [Symbiodinium sp. CCMP2592]
MLRTCIAIATICEALTTPARHVVPLHRQRVPVQGEDDRISYKSVYFGSVTVGSPEQKFAVVFDTGSGHVIIPSSECHSETCRIHNRYNREASPAAVDVDYDGSPVQAGSPRDQITVAFGTGEVTGQFVQDRLCLGSHGAAPAAPAIAVPSYTEPLLLVQSGEAELGRTPSAQKGHTKALGNASNAMLLSQALNCVDLRVVMATEMTEEPFHAFSFDGVLGLGLRPWEAGASCRAAR